MKSLVAIVGRPNVGKSALFNRLVGRRAAIVHAQSGVTRDRLALEAVWEDRRFELVDTGGLVAAGREQAPNRIEAGIRQQVDAALADAAVAILVADLDAGLVGADRDVAEHVRRTGLPVAVAANKADAPQKDTLADEFSALGFPVFPVSALHNRGVGSLMRHVLAHVPATQAAAQSQPLNIAIVGRPNVGKSSFVNRIVRSERVLVSDMPGTTRDSVDIPFVYGKGKGARPYVLIDTAGMRRAGKIDSAVERYGRMRAETSVARADVVVLMLDATVGPTAFDKKIATLVLRHRKGCLLAVNKWDMAETTQRQWRPALLREMPFMDHCPAVFVSAKTGFNIRQSLEAMDHVAALTRATLPTALLNRVVLDLHAKAQMPIARGKRPKLYYAAQTGQAPLRVRIFVNYPKSVAPAYRVYLVRGLRRAFGLEGAFLDLEFRARRTNNR